MFFDWKIQLEKVQLTQDLFYNIENKLTRFHIYPEPLY